MKVFAILVVVAFAGCKSDSQQIETVLDEQSSAARDLHSLERESIQSFRMNLHAMQSQRIINKNDVIKLIESYFKPRYADLESTLLKYDQVMKLHFSGESNMYYTKLRATIEGLSFHQLGRAANLLDLLYMDSNNKFIIFG